MATHATTKPIPWPAPKPSKSELEQAADAGNAQAAARLAAQNRK